VLRYWESEFSSLRPRKDNKAGRRNYQKKDIETILQIKDLRIAGAKKKLRGKEGKEQIAKERNLVSTLKEVRKELQTVLNILSK